MPSINATRERFSCIKPEYGNASIVRSLAAGKLTKSDAHIMTEFLAERRAAGRISPGRNNMVTFTLIIWRRFLPPFSELTMGSIYTGIETIKQAHSSRGRPFKQNTLVDHMIILKQFVLWMIENDYLNLPKKKIRAIKNPPKDRMTKTAADILTPQEIHAIVAACQNSRDRALDHVSL